MKKRWLRSLLLLVCVAAVCLGSRGVSRLAERAEAVPAPVYDHRVAAPHHEGTVVSGEESGVRLVNSRSRSFSPPSALKWKRASGKWAAGLSFQLPIAHCYGGRWLPLSSQRRPVASCDYYVYALRRILR